MEKNYNPSSLESDCYQYWEKSGYFQPSGTGESFSIVIPPPNVTGVLHMGHALNLTLQDIVIRFKRMQGFNTLWVPGEDHAGIATQNVVEKQLKTQGVSRFDMGRDAFVEKVWEWKTEYANRITNQIRRLGASVDWTHERFTMDDGCAVAVRENFVSLYEQGLIYQGAYMVNWCPRCHTALSDIEVEHEEQEGSLWEIKYPFTNDADKFVVVATTRPETMFGDTAIAVSPDDERYQDLIGQTVRIPFTTIDIPIITDTHVDKSFGTGALKITPAHDVNDYDIGKRHALAQVVVMDEKGKMNENAPEKYQGLDRYDCRDQLVKDLEQHGYLVRIQPHVLSIGHCYRCHTIIEPYISKQWFVDMKPLATEAIEAVRSGDIRFIPNRWEKLYFDWMENIRDWCISRQIWWGHRIPVWYCECDPKKPIVSRENVTVCPACQGSTLTQDEDVLDTWFSSALWPFSVMGWPEKTDGLDTYYPTNLLITGYDIITFWVSRMITMGLKQTQKNPFSDVFIHGLVRDISGKKMSKSLGNALNPLALIDEFGADALRYSLASLTTVGGQDIKFSEEKVQAARNFGNKVWNVARYLLMILDETDAVIDSSQVPATTQFSDQWILSLFFTTLDKVSDGYDSYNFSQVSDLLWEFSWNQFCDWYIEISKMNKADALPVLVYVFVNLLKMMHPMMPFITEEIWQALIKTGKIKLESDALIVSDWPKPHKESIDITIEKQMAIIIQVIREIRFLRKQAGVQPGKKVNIILVTIDAFEKELLDLGQDIIKRLAKVESIEILDQLAEKPAQASTSVVQHIELFLPLSGLIDLDEERSRIQKKLDQLTVDILGCEKKLSNTQFLEKAPAAVVEKIKTKQALLLEEKQLVEKQLNSLI